MSINSDKNNFTNWLKTSISARMIMVGILAIFLLIPLFFTTALIDEREMRKNIVIKEIYENWGEKLQISGPIIKVPFKIYTGKTISKNDQETYREIQEAIDYFYIYPDLLHIKSNLHPEERHIGIYETTVYESFMEFNGNFRPLDELYLIISTDKILWEDAKIIVQTNNIKGISSDISISLNEFDYGLSVKEWSHASSDPKWYQLESDKINLKQAFGKKNFSFNLKIFVKGSQSIQFLPTGKTTTLEMFTPWKSTKFIGYFSPVYKIEDKGIDAKWEIFEYNRPFNLVSKSNNFLDYKFGASFLISVNEYHKNQRAIKYGFLIILLTMIVFFLIQSIGKFNVHPFQYLMVGIALVLFYTLLLSITEQFSFNVAYIIAAIMTITLISWYAKVVFSNIKFSFIVAITLTLLYGFIFAIIQLENYALLFGSIGLFCILAVVMYVSRKLNFDNY